MENCELEYEEIQPYLLRVVYYVAYFNRIIKIKTAVTKGNNIDKSNIIQDEKKNNIVVVDEIRFMGRQNIKWREVEDFLKGYIGNHYEIIDTSDLVFIGTDFPEELKGSEDTKRLKGTNAKAKANATLKIPLLLKYATNKRWQENYKTKHGIDAKHGWYRFTSRFALPIYANDGEIEKYSIFRIEMLMRHAADGKLYLYDMVNVKKEKETGTPLGQ